MEVKHIEFDRHVEALLSAEGLPVSDLQNSQQVRFFGLKDDEDLIGVVGIERFNDLGFLRSLVVKNSLRESGHGNRLMHAAESWAERNEIKELYLLTTSTFKFFSSYGYQALARDQAPTVISMTRQFSSLCPSSAILMHKNL